jgi:N6-adenosine-specific RNA methylase IME4
MSEANDCTLDALLGRGFKTIVADPPWEMKRGSNYGWRKGRMSGERMTLDYPTMTLDEIRAMPVSNVVSEDAHLFLWTTQKHMEATYGIARAWGFAPTCALVWCKAPHGWGPGGVFQSTVEFVIYGRRGRPMPNKHTINRQWFEWPRGRHSAKPEAFQDMVQDSFPEPRLEMFARRPRLGWTCWGNEVDTANATKGTRRKRRTRGSRAASSNAWSDLLC